MDISAIVLYKLLDQKNLEVWGKLKLAFLDPAYSSVYGAVHRHYENYSEVPSFEDLDISLREGVTRQVLEAIKLADVPEVTIDVALDALIDNYTQNEAIRLLDRFIDKIPVYDTNELKENLASIVLTLDEKTLTTEGVYAMNDILLFRNEEDLKRDRIPLGLNNTFDSVIQTVRGEYILLGGKRGSGKSIVASNIVANQYEAGNTAVQFTIEMSGHETFERNMAMLANVDYQAIKQNKLDETQVLALVKTRAAMFENADDLVLEFMKTKNKFKFEETLLNTKSLKQDNQMVIIDDRSLTLTTIDIQLGKLKAKFGDKLTVCVVDYLNQIRVEGKATYDWQPQIDISTKLKELARKYDVLMVSPYQIDASGEARFAKGILDAADIALVLTAHDKDLGALSYETTKIRGASEMNFTSPIDWSTLRISSNNMEMPAPKESAKPKKQHKSHKQDDSSGDMPAW
jgi:replicative DNA helicase